MGGPYRVKYVTCTRLLFHGVELQVMDSGHGEEGVCVCVCVSRETKQEQGGS